MSVQVLTSCVLGVDSYEVEVEVHLSNGLPSFTIVGLPDAACRESQARVRSAIHQSGFRFPPQKITVNLAPADIRKEGTGFDLPIAMAILSATEQIPKELGADIAFCGELALDGRVRGISGALPRAVAFQNTGKSFVLPSENAREVGCVEGAVLYGVAHLTDVVSLIVDGLTNKFRIQPNIQQYESDIVFEMDFAEVKGQVLAKRGIEVAVAGGHNLLLMGPPGSGKTMLAKRVPSILPPMSIKESLETTTIHSVAGALQRGQSFLKHRPFREPHHTISDVALIGGGTHPKPGEISLAHNGILFMDEFPEFKRNVLEVLRQPLEQGRVVVSRAAQTVSFPASFNLVAAMNPCPCGYLSHEKQPCTCSPKQIRGYLNKLSGPLLDRIDIHLEVSTLSKDDYLQNVQGESSSVINSRVCELREIQKHRYKSAPFKTNARLEGRWIERFCKISQSGKSFLAAHLDKLGYSARAYHKVLKVALTLADMSRKTEITDEHLCEAIQYRCLDRITRLQAV